MKREVNPFDYAGEICKALPGGILLTTKRGEEVNSMTIGWGCIGIDWTRPVFIAYVRESRYTKQLLEENGEFTVNIPVGEVPRAALSLCGRKSGRDMNKIEKLNLTLEEPLEISVPGIRQLPLTLECKVIYKQQQDLSAIPQDILDRYYPVEDDTLHPGSDRDYHIAYTGQILKAYIIED
jgi:flavin reductase (DIM6/NTAB) family NADH-FMN oxidoreductase RutF